jgi:hypothetical protein
MSCIFVSSEIVASTYVFGVCRYLARNIKSLTASLAVALLLEPRRHDTLCVQRDSGATLSFVSKGY